jgi:hypothetical protein
MRAVGRCGIFKGGKIMNIADLYNFILPLINILGTLCLTGLVAGGVLYVTVKIMGRLWKVVATVGMIMLGLFFVVALLGGA